MRSQAYQLQPATRARLLPQRNSISDPLKVDRLPKEYTSTAGSVVMAMHPGRQDVGLSAEWSRDLDIDFAALKKAGVRTIVCLVERHEFTLLKVPDYLERAEAAGFKVIWYPYQDVSTPPSMAGAHGVIYQIWEALQAGDVLVHCRGGKGRTGSIVVGLLEMLGYSFEDALQIVRHFRQGTVETVQQEDWCEAFGRYLRKVASHGRNRS